MPITIEDVARTAGVSTATVSRALRGLPHVSASTRAEVARIAGDLGYVPSRSATNLATGRTRTVGLVTPHIATWYFAQAIEAVEQGLRAEGFDVLLMVLPPLPGQARPSFDAEQLRQRVDAVCVLTVPLTGTELDGLRALRLPTVFVGGSIAGSMSVRIDDVEVGRRACEHLIALGHRRIAYIGGDPEEPLNFQAPVDRRAGWMSALRSADLDPEPALDVVGFFTVEGGRAAMHALLGQCDPPTAVFAASDEMAFGAIDAARAAGVAVPGEVSVIGVDGHDLAPLFDLTTVAQPVLAQGRYAAELLLAALRGDRGHVQEHKLLEVSLTVRGTTGRPAHARTP